MGLAHNVELRRRTLNIGNPSYLYLFHVDEFPSLEEAKKAEKQVHYSLVSDHIRGEWFDINEKEVSRIKTAILNIRLFEMNVPDGWSLEKKVSEEFTTEVCKMARLAKGISQEELSGLSGVSVKAIMAFESGESSPRISTIESLKQALCDQGVEFVSSNEGRYKILL